ncbi:hypothetical protein ACOMHN_001176 [Nucella lapillus]
MGADLDKIKRCSDDDDKVSSESENEEDGAEEDVMDPQEEPCLSRNRSGSIYNKPKWQDQVAGETEDDVDLFAHDERQKLCRAHTVAACRFRHRTHQGTPLHVIREETRFAGSDLSLNILKRSSSRDLAVPSYRMMSIFSPAAITFSGDMPSGSLVNTTASSLNCTDFLNLLRTPRLPMPKG